MAVMVYRLMAKILITAIRVNFVMIPGEARMKQHKLIRITAIKILPSTYTITAISWLPPLISKFFHAEQGRTFLQPGCF